MTYTLFFIPDYQFQQVFFYVSLGNNFVYCFCGGPLVVEAPWQLPSLHACVVVHTCMRRNSKMRRKNRSDVLAVQHSLFPAFAGCVFIVLEVLMAESYTVVMLLTFIRIIISIPSPLHLFIPGLKPSFSANPSHRSLPFLLQD